MPEKNVQTACRLSPESIRIACWLLPRSVRIACHLSESKIHQLKLNRIFLLTLANLELTVATYTCTDVVQNVKLWLSLSTLVILLLLWFVIITWPFLSLDEYLQFEHIKRQAWLRNGLKQNNIVVKWINI